MKLNKSKSLTKRANMVIPGGVNSPVRAFKAVGGVPLFIKKAKGAKIWDEDGNEYIDFVGSWGPLILGHGNERVEKAIKKALKNGTTFGAPTKCEIELAEKIINIFPSIDMVRLVNSGTEATMSAIRLARGYTGKKKIIKFEGCYHGHVDSLLVKAGSGAMTFGVPTSNGIPESVVYDTIVLPYNNEEIFSSVIKDIHNETAAVIIEPVPGNMGVVLPKKGFLEKVREETKKYGIILIFDEVITGLRIAQGGAQERFAIEADLTCLGKIIGGGLPVGAYGGKKEIMEHVSPLGSVYQAGTLSGNPLAVSAGLETVKIIMEMSKEGFYENLEEKAIYLNKELKQIAYKEGLKVTGNQIGSMLTLFFTEHDVYDYDSAKTSSEEKYSVYFWKMLEEGIYLAPSQYEASFISTAHSDEFIEKMLKAAAIAFKEVKKQFN